MTRRTGFWLALATIDLLLVYAGYRVYRHYTRPDPYATAREGWQAAFRERGLPVPAAGPREGYWGSRLKTRRDPAVGWRHDPMSEPGVIEIDARGMQRAGACEGCPHILILGGSLALGTYASDAEAAYFSRVAAALRDRGSPVRITVLAAAAWKSAQEIAALTRDGPSLHPDVVLFLNGLNDLTAGFTAAELWGTEPRNPDGTPQHRRDYGARVTRYLENMRAAARRNREGGVLTVVALQPALFEKTPRSAIEARTERLSMQPPEIEAALRQSYAAMRDGLRALDAAGDAVFVDASRVFDGETATVFTDVWHFPDPGQAILARFLAGRLAPMLAALRRSPDAPRATPRTP